MGFNDDDNDARGTLIEGGFVHPRAPTMAELLRGTGAVVAPPMPVEDVRGEVGKLMDQLIEEAIANIARPEAPGYQTGGVVLPPEQRFPVDPDPIEARWQRMVQRLNDLEARVQQLEHARQPYGVDGGCY